MCLPTGRVFLPAATLPASWRGISLLCASTCNDMSLIMCSHVVTQVCTYFSSVCYVGSTGLCMCMHMEARGQLWVLTGSLDDLEIVKEARVAGPQGSACLCLLILER